MILVPKNAIVKGGGESFVWLVRDGIARRAPVLTGREFEHSVEIKGGLDDGQTVIVAPPTALIDGKPVFSKTSN